MVKISYITPFYTGQCDGRYGRFHDWIHTLRDMESPAFDFDVHAATSSNPDETLASPPLSVLGDGDELYATKRNNIESLINIPQMYRGVQRSDPDLVHIVASDLMLLPPTLLAVESIPVVLGPNIGGWYPNRNDTMWKSNRVSNFKNVTKFWLRKQIAELSGYNKVIAFSEYHQEMISRLGVPETDIIALHPGVDPIFSPSQSKVLNPIPELLYIGDLSKHKGYDIFLRALAQLDRDANARVIGFGDPNRALIQRLGITDLVSVEGFVARQNLPDYYRSADICVIPSIDEMGPNTQVEALASGTPVVTTDSPGLNEYPPRDSAIFFWPRDVQTLSDALREAIDNLNSLTEAAITHSSNFGAHKTVDNLTDIYQDMV